MHVVAIHGWKQESAELAQTISAASGLTVFEVRQRIAGCGPAVLACFADPRRARELAAALEKAGIATLTVDSELMRSGVGHFVVRRFELGAGSLRIEAVDGQTAEIAYDEIDLLLSGTRISGQTEWKTVTECKFSLGRTLLSGGIPLTKAVSRQQELTTEARTRILYLLAGERPQVLFRQSGMSYDGFGSAMKMSQELNFAYLTRELRRLSLGADYDERLVHRVGQVRLLGPAQNLEAGLDLAAEILGRGLRRLRENKPVVSFSGQTIP